MTLINSCSGMALEIVQRSNAPNDAWRNLESHYRAKGTREILRLSHETNGKTMEPGGDPFMFIMKLRKCVNIVSGMSAGFEMECRMLENNPAGLNRAEIERVLGNQYNRLLRQQQDSKALSASKGTVTANRGKGKHRRPRHKFDENCFNCRKQGRRAGDCRSAKKSKNPELPTTRRKALAAVGATSAGVRSTLRTGTVVCARALSTERETVRSAELKKAQCWQNWLCRRFLR